MTNKEQLDPESFSNYIIQCVNYILCICITIHVCLWDVIEYCH